MREMVGLSWSVLHLPGSMCLTRSVLVISIPIKTLWLEFNLYNLLHNINNLNDFNDNLIIILY